MIKLPIEVIIALFYTFFTGVDMCADPDTNNCDINAICITTTISNINDKGFVCLCNTGYTGSGEMGNCIGI